MTKFKNILKKQILKKNYFNYLIDDNNQKRPIVSGEIFEKLGFDWKNINEIEDAVINRYVEGEVIKE